MSLDEDHHFTDLPRDMARTVEAANNLGQQFLDVLKRNISLEASNNSLRVMAERAIMAAEQLKGELEQSQRDSLKETQRLKAERDKACIMRDLYSAELTAIASGANATLARGSRAQAAQDHDMKGRPYAPRNVRA
jgi:hypothetical protein